MVQSKKVITLIVLTVGFQSLNAETRWTSVAGDSYEVVTDAGAAPASLMAHRIEQMRELLGRSNKILPLRVVMLASAERFSALRPSATVAGFFQSGADRDWIVVQWGREDSERALSHEMVHALLEHSGPRRPLWLEEGLAEFYSTAFRDGKAWTLGRPIEAHVQSLNRRAWLGEREFFEVRPDSPVREEDRRVGQFYAQSWAVVHYLLTSPVVRQKAPALFEAMAAGVPFARACEESLGMRQGLLIENARRAVESGRMPLAQLAAGQSAPAAARPVALTAAEAEAMLVDLAFAAGRPALARQTARTPLQLGLLALSNGDRAEAERQFERAVAAGSADAAPYFELAMLRREDRRDPDGQAALLRQTIERNPNHAEAHFLLGLRGGDSAIEHLREAARILPRQATFWHALALAFERDGRLEEAGEAALRCSQAARNAAEREMAEGVARLVRVRERPAAAAKKPAVQVPEAWNGLRGDAELEGVLVEFDCGARPAVLWLESDGRRIPLRVTRPEEIRIGGTGEVKHTFACGAQRAPVRVEYLRATGELTAVTFR